MSNNRPNAIQRRTEKGWSVFATFNSTIVQITAVGDFIMVETEDGAIVYVDKEGRKHLLPIKPR